jgi:hypothetical protein
MAYSQDNIASNWFYVVPDKHLGNHLSFAASPQALLGTKRS